MLSCGSFLYRSLDGFQEENNKPFDLFLSSQHFFLFAPWSVVSAQNLSLLGGKLIKPELGELVLHTGALLDLGYGIHAPANF